VPNLVQIRTRGLLGKQVKYNTFDFISYNFFSETLLQVRPLDGFLYGSKDAFTQGCAFWGLKMLKSTLNPFLCPQRSNFGKKVNRKFLAENALQWRRSGVNDP